MADDLAPQGDHSQIPATAEDPSAAAAHAGDDAASETPGELTPLAPIGQEAAAVTPPDPDAPECKADTLFIRGDFGLARFNVAVAETPEERNQGLMFVEQMPMSTGMLFVYPSQRPVAFWMKNTLIPLDMIFADQHGVVVDVHENAVPGDLTSIPSAEPAQYVLEVNGGLTRLLGISEGDQLNHQAITEAAWPCRIAAE
ncbi:DUF192 domain-containing protein [Tropicibacter naphthalenivorans]|nr:DUF192 domain-containing protein [Tropicibacter naphthalenivorans]